tara:strand:+ start:567 stop:944 length:378 start_codon:yes stop_codon:yes gene_type:complete
MIDTPVSYGEVADKYTILRIKSLRIKDESKLININKEKSLLEEIVHTFDKESLVLVEKLFMVNVQLWDIEDSIRDKERNKEFDELFIAYARLVYHTNDRRMEIKGQINQQMNSGLVEEKSYEDYE